MDSFILVNSDLRAGKLDKSTVIGEIYRNSGQPGNEDNMKVS